MVANSVYNQLLVIRLRTLSPPFGVASRYVAEATRPPAEKSKGIQRLWLPDKYLLLYLTLQVVEWVDPFTRK